METSNRMICDTCRYGYNYGMGYRCKIKLYPELAIKFARCKRHEPKQVMTSKNR